MKVKVVNLNTWMGGKETWNSIVHYLSVEKPDIVLLQEALASPDLNAPLYMRTATSLQKILGYQYVEYAAQYTLMTDYGRAPVGCAILSNFPVINTKTIWLYQDTNSMKSEEILDPAALPRSFLHCEIAVGSRICNVMSLQGVWAKDNIETRLQKDTGKKLARYISSLSNVIMGGDFNVNENTETIQEIENYLINVFRGKRTSSFNMNFKDNPNFATAIVDYIFISAGIKLTDCYSSIDDVSDHTSQVVVLEV